MGTTTLSMVSDFHLDLLFQQESKDTTMAQRESASDEIAETTTISLKVRDTKKKPGAVTDAVEISTTMPPVTSMQTNTSTGAMVSSKEEETTKSVPTEEAEVIAKQIINEKTIQPTTLTSSATSVTSTILATTSMNTKTTSTLTTTAGEEIVTPMQVKKEDSVAIPVTTETSILQPISIITTIQSVPTTTGPTSTNTMTTSSKTTTEEKVPTSNMIEKSKDNSILVE